MQPVYRLNGICDDSSATFSILNETTSTALLNQENEGGCEESSHNQTLRFQRENIGLVQIAKMALAHKKALSSMEQSENDEEILTRNSN